MSQKYSITSNTGSNNRRKSVFTPSINNTGETSSQTVELERLEQEITLTLQNIDKSFSKSHKIINDRLLPIVKKYHTNSKKIWSGVNFWKTFLEASANVELRGYEEAVQHNADQEELSSTSEQLRSDAVDDQMRENEELSPVKIPTSIGVGEDILMESTVDLQKKSKGKELKNNPIMPQINQKNIGFDTSDSILPSLPPISVNITNTNETDVNQTTPTLQRTESRHYVIHNNLDTTYKLEVSPRKSRKRSSVVHSVTPKKKRKSFYQQKFDSSPFELEPPQLKSDVLFSPVRRTSPLKKVVNSTDHLTKAFPSDENETQRFPLTPRYGAGGNLLRTPSQVEQTAKRYSGHNFQSELPKNIDTNNNQFEDTEDPTISPPVTIHFATANDIRNQDDVKNKVNDILDNVSGIDDSVDLNKDADKVKDSGKAVLENDFDTYLDKPTEKSIDNADWSE